MSDNHGARYSHEGVPGLPPKPTAADLVRPHPFSQKPLDELPAVVDLPLPATPAQE